MLVSWCSFTMSMVRVGLYLWAGFPVAVVFRFKGVRSSRDRVFWEMSYVSREIVLEVVASVLGVAPLVTRRGRFVIRIGFALGF